MLYLYCISFIIILMALESSVQVNYEPRSWTKITYSDLFFGMIFFTLMFLTMFRGDSIGNDTRSYIYNFNKIVNYGDVNSDDRMEVGFQFFCLLVSKFSKDPHVFIAVSGFVIYLIVGIFFKKKCHQPIYAISLFFCTSFSHYTNVVRMAFAISILLWAFEALKNKKLVYGILLFTIAILFHKSYLLAIPVAVIVYWDLKFTPKLFALTSIAVLALSIGGTFFLGMLGSASEMLGGRFGGYLSGTRTETGSLGTIFSISKLIVLFLIYKNTVKDKIPDYVKWYFAFALLFYILNFAMNLFDRISSAFLLFLLVPVINGMIESESEKKKRNIMLLIIFFIFTFLFTAYIRPEWNHLYPYEFMF